MIGCQGPDTYISRDNVAVEADEYFFFPIVALALIGGMVLLLRWAFSSDKGSLVRRIDYSPAARDTFGLLVDVYTSKTYADARSKVEMLTSQQVRATAARTTEGWSIYVWPADETAARAILKAP
ncbi:MAG: hypothetical protein QOH50_890 [Kribbellaceae bacterium]|nr:hypothetical protein [Kribbellaceae bacterium]